MCILTGFIIGFIIGGFIGVVITCLCVINGKHNTIDDDEYYEWYEDENMKG